jgi:predicted peptidase
MTGLARQAGVYEQHIPHNQGRYTIALPAGYSEARATPLILALHWGGSVTPFFGKGVLLGLVQPALHELGAIIVAPDCAHGGWDNPRSEADICDLLAYLQEHYNLDRERCLVTGYSIGGMGAWYLAARQPGWFTAAIPMASPPPRNAPQIDWQIPLYVIHSRSDELFAYEETLRSVRRLRETGAPIEICAVDGVTHFYTGGFIQPLGASVPWIQKVWGLAKD